MLSYSSLHGCRENKEETIGAESLVDGDLSQSLLSTWVSGRGRIQGFDRGGKIVEGEIFERSRKKEIIAVMDF